MRLFYNTAKFQTGGSLCKIASSEVIFKTAHVIHPPPMYVCMCMSNRVCTYGLRVYFQPAIRIIYLISDTFDTGVPVQVKKWEVWIFVIWRKRPSHENGIDFKRVYLFIYFIYCKTLKIVRLFPYHHSLGEPSVVYVAFAQDIVAHQVLLLHTKSELVDRGSFPFCADS